jgi:hypothetical protein
VDHGLETHVDFSGADDFGNICSHPFVSYRHFGRRKRRTGRIVRLEKSNLDILLGEESLLLCKEDRRVVGRRVPSVFPHISITNYSHDPKNQNPPVQQERDLVSRHLSPRKIYIHQVLTNP